MTFPLTFPKTVRTTLSLSMKVWSLIPNLLFRPDTKRRVVLPRAVPKSIDHLRSRVHRQTNRPSVGYECWLQCHFSFNPTPYFHTYISILFRGTSLSHVL